MAQIDNHHFDIYQPRNPKASAYYKCVENHFEELERAWDDMYASRYGFWRTYVMTVIYKYLDCGDLHIGFARVRCEECGHEYLLAFSCKRRQFCPSCHQKRVIEYGEWLLTEVLKDVPHRQWVFSIPKRLRIYFLYDRKLLAKLSICAWKVMNTYLKSVVSDETGVPGASIAVQTYGDFLNFNPHLHAITTDGCFLNDGSFKAAPGFILEDLEKIFQYEVLKMLKKEGKINDAVIENMLSWRHSGFHVYIGDRITPSDTTGLGNLARYIIRACFSQERMVYVPVEDLADGIAKVVYISKDGKSRKVFTALDWLARLTTHIPGRYEQTVRYYGWYSNKSRGMRKKAGTDDTIPAVMPNDISSKESRRNWARLIRKIYEVDPLVCPKCHGEMKIISFIEEFDVIEKILRHLDLWDIHNHDPPQKVFDYILDLVCAWSSGYDEADSRIPEFEHWY
ncbi:IS91 family transposase [Desulfotignum phosphitoxidans]|jgi:Zn finger protein HypA/HybF involved in hydrogenase expression|uniref:Transposase n=3 Tax=Desulfotignum phosphitoxidans TaxID=190898 RepID=S0G1A5_9BACT|nr:IS91 family transposase [Desulfotignum phosphitoxidans]ADB92506.1 putative transposase [Desulfotignum phosphitoxidans DSM 13687]EMS77964.1 zinc-binding domain-containing transposase [Desulfotignum phosphitoxidans DSM 13687]EMS77977.1 transposase [Desulfotignum phosphitoxidans DSM 13687]EMS77994.1 transposase, IS91/Y2 family [Desulfotignum phosphitoxidans DSM 13687]